MALQKNITLASGINLPNAFIKITGMMMKCGGWCDISVGIYKDQSAYIDGKPSVVEFTHRCQEHWGQYFDVVVISAAGINPISQAYLYLKTLPFYTSATDVLGIKG